MPNLRRPHLRTRSAAWAVGLVCLVLPALAVEVSSPAAAAGPAAAATPTPGMGAPVPCAAQVSFVENGTAHPARPMPSATSRVGGTTLADPGLHVTPSATAAPPSPKASAWMVADLDTGQVLAACNAHAPLAPASTLKVLTALALVGKVDPATSYVARDADARIDGTRVGLVPGATYTADDLWHALIMSSANDAATGLSALAGGDAVAVAAMRQTALDLGALDTVPHNTSGLDEPGQVSSAYDLALFGRAALAVPRLVTLMQTREYAFPDARGGGTATGTGRRTYQIQNHNRLIYNYPGALGVKNGWTSAAGGSFVGAAQRGGRRIVVTMLAADPETWHISASLLDWAFTATPAGAQGVGRLVSGPEAAAAASAAAASGTPASGAAGRADAAPLVGSLLTGPGAVGRLVAVGLGLAAIGGGVLVLRLHARSRRW